jgi:hypothetical protein
MPPRRDHRKRCHGIDYGGQQYHRADSAPDMAACFDTLRAEHVRAEVGGALCFIG